MNLLKFNFLVYQQYVGYKLKSPYLFWQVRYDIGLGWVSPIHVKPLLKSRENFPTVSH